MVTLYAYFDELEESYQLYQELKPYHLNVTQHMLGWVIHGHISIMVIPVILLTLYKYGTPKVTINKNPS